MSVLFIYPIFFFFFMTENISRFSCCKVIASLLPILLIGRSRKPGSSYIPGNSRQAYSYCIRRTLIRYGGRHLLVWRSPLFLWVKTMGNVMDSNLMHINDLPQPYSTLTRPQRGLISSLYHQSPHYTFSIQIPF